MKIKAAWREVQFANSSRWVWLAGCGDYDRIGTDLGKVIDALRRDFAKEKPQPVASRVNIH